MKRGAARAIAVSLCLAAVFEAALFASKQTPAIYGHAPWLNDPYDTAVSFALFCVPLIAIPTALRFLAFRGEPATARLADLLRACGVALTAVAVTLAACWAAVALGANRGAWTSVTALQTGGLVLLSVSALACAVALRRSAAGLRSEAADAERTAVAHPAPDWLGDLISAGRLLARRAGPVSGLVVWLLDWADNRVLPIMRRHPVATAASIGAAFAVPVTISQSVHEGYQPGTAAMFFCVTTSGVFAFLAMAGGYLHVVRSPPPAGARAPLRHATVLAAATVPVALAFRGTLWSLVGGNPRTSGLPALCLLLASAALLAFAVSLAAEHVARSRRV
jgi:hypothetical protein